MHLVVPDLCLQSQQSPLIEQQARCQEAYWRGLGELDSRALYSIEDLHSYCHWRLSVWVALLVHDHTCSWQPIESREG